MAFLGNEKARRTVQDMVQSGRLSHALLLVGSRGVGKKTFAREIAAAQLCEENAPPCLGCNICRRVLTSQHPDVEEIAQYEKPRSFPVDEVRRIRREAYMSPNEGKCRVFILANVESMGAPAQNALLKILEEPPAHTRFILTAQSPDALLSTILSRVVTVPVLPLSEQVAKDELRRRCPNVADETVQLGLRLFGGNLGQLSDLAQSEALLTEARDAEALLSPLFAREHYEVLRRLTAKAANPQLARFLDYVVLLLEYELTHNSTVPPKRLMALLSAAIEGKRALGMNANKTLLMTHLAMALDV